MHFDGYDMAKTWGDGKSQHLRKTSKVSTKLKTQFAENKEYRKKLAKYTAGAGI